MDHPADLNLELYLTEIEISERVQEMGEQISSEFTSGKLLIISVLNGAFIFTADLVRNITINHELIFTKVRSYNGIRSGNEIEHQLMFDGRIKGKNVLIIEDIIDTGKTLDFLLGEIDKKEPASISVAALLWKPDVYGYPHKIRYVGFSIPHEFVIGYGMDYNDYGRNLKDIYIFKNYKS